MGAADAPGIVGYLHPDSLYGDLATRLPQVGEVIDVGSHDGTDRSGELGRVDVLLSHPHLEVDAAMIERAPDLRAILAPGVGFDGIDLEAATARGILVTHHPAGNATAVAEHALGLMLSVLKRIGWGDRHMRAGKPWWPGQRQFVNHELTGRRLGLVGVGAIGQRLAAMAGSFAMPVRAHDPYVDQPPPGVEMCDLDEVLTTSDVLSLHVPLTPATRGMIGPRELALLPADAVVINTARGGVLDLDALVAAVENGHLWGAGLDVFDGDELPTDHPVLALDEVVVTPHIGGTTHESQDRRAARQFDAVRELLLGRRPTGVAVVNPDAIARFEQRFALD